MTASLSGFLLSPKRRKIIIPAAPAINTSSYIDSWYIAPRPPSHLCIYTRVPIAGAVEHCPFCIPLFSSDPIVCSMGALQCSTAVTAVRSKFPRRDARSLYICGPEVTDIYMVQCASSLASQSH